MPFPTSPTTGQQTTQGDRLYQWSGTTWDLVLGVSTHASTHAANGSDALTLVSSQISDFATAAAAASAADDDQVIIANQIFG